jgi:hypothetical protein
MTSVQLPVALIVSPASSTPKQVREDTHCCTLRDASRLGGRTFVTTNGRKRRPMRWVNAFLGRDQRRRSSREDGRAAHRVHRARLHHIRHLHRERQRDLRCLPGARP